jgi:predicted lipid-binding transport protein (Tim44 family)
MASGTSHHIGPPHETGLQESTLEMNGQMDLITLISLIVAAVAILKLRSVLGQRSDEDDARVERLKTRDREAQKSGNPAQSGEVITLPRRDREDAVLGPVEAPGSDIETRIRAYTTADPSVTEGLLEIAKFDPEIDPDAFVQGAGRAYEMIVTAFADGDRKALKELLSREVYDGFVAAIADRESRGEAVDQQFVGIRKAEIFDADMKAGIANLSVRFISELITASRDKAGNVIAGDPQKIKEVTDIWTFSRDISNARQRSNPNWRLIATQAPN